MDLKEKLFNYTQDEYDLYQYMKAPTNSFINLDQEQQKERFNSLYSLIEEAGLTDEYNKWIEEHPSRLKIM